MKPSFVIDRHDLIAFALVIICSPVFALLQGYQEKALFGSVPAAMLASFPLGMAFTFPLFIYFLIKYSIRFRAVHRQVT